MIGFVSVVLLILILICAVAALTVRDLMGAVIIFGAFSFFSALFFAVFGAVDVAFTEAAVGAGITTLFFVTTLYRTGTRGER